MNKYNFSEQDLINLEANFPNSFFQLDYLKLKRENMELKQQLVDLNNQFKKKP